MTSNFTRTVTVAICAILASATMVLSTVGQTISPVTYTVSGNRA